MKYLSLCFNILICAVVFLFSAIGLSVHKSHAISVAAEIAKTYNIADDKRGEIEKTVGKTGNAAFYYSKAATTAEVGIAINLALVIYSLWRRNVQPSSGSALSNATPISAEEAKRP